MVIHYKKVEQRSKLLLIDDWGHTSFLVYEGIVIMIELENLFNDKASTLLDWCLIKIGHCDLGGFLMGTLP